MARVLSGAAALSHRFGAGLGFRRHRHTRRRAELLEVDAVAGPSTSSEGVAERRFEEAIELAIARMAEPDWAPFRPGTSYFAPPYSSGARAAAVALGLVVLVKRGDGSRLRALSVDEARAVASPCRGYPCSTYFIDGRFPDEVVNSAQGTDSAEDR